MFQTGFGGKKARPLFRILGYKLRDQISPQNLLTSETKAPPTLAEEMGDSVPFNDPTPDLGKAESSEASTPPLPNPRRNLKKPAKINKPTVKRHAKNILDAG
jgi:hypothetical protein